MYYVNAAAVPEIDRVPLNGSGKPEAIPGAAIPDGIVQPGLVSISPDGQTLAYAVGLTDTQAQTNKVKIAVLSTKSLVSPRLLDPNPRIALRTAFYYDGLRFTPDGKAVAYGVTENGASNIWVQPLDGSAGHLITNFKTEEILAFRWSPDGKSLGILRGHSESDVVLLHESKP